MRRTTRQIKAAFRSTWHAALPLAGLALFPGGQLAQVGLGNPPAETLGARDLALEYHLPALHDQAEAPLHRSLERVQVIARAKRLRLDLLSGTRAWYEAETIYETAQKHAAEQRGAAPKVFDGHLASDLNRMMSVPGPCRVQVISPTLRLDEPIYPGDACKLDLGRTLLQSQGHQPYQIQIKGRHDVRLTGGRLTGGSWGVSVTHSRGVVVSGMTMRGLHGGGIMVTNSYEVTVRNNHLSSLGGAGIMVHGNTQHAIIVDNVLSADTGWSNWHAGIVVTDRNADPGDDATTLLRTDGILVTQTRITDRLTVPHDNVIARNQIVGNKTSGIYSDGGARNLFLQNTVRGNSKEGMCLDNGSTSNIVAFNLFQANGKRWGTSDTDLKRDFVWNYGRLPDGTSPAKLPGLSMDNAAYNQVVLNTFDGNFGSGIKMVRTDFYNLIGLNTLTDNNEGANTKLHYFGILVGYAGADDAAWDLDFVPSRGNEVFSNEIRGSHFAGIFFEDGADQNTVFDNSIFGATMWAMDSFRPQPEETFNNLSNLPLRNIDSGLDPHLLALARGRRE